MKNRNIFSVTLFLLYISLLISLIFSFRAICSISIALLLLTGLAKNKIEQGRFFVRNPLNALLVSCIVFYFIQLAGLLYTHNMHEQWINLRIKTALIVLPLAFSCNNFINEQTRKKLLTFYILILFLAMMYSFARALWNFKIHQDTSVFFYYDLTKYILKHAIQVSILVVIALVCLLEGVKNNHALFNIRISIIFIIGFTGFLFLLSSKLFISLFILYLIYFLFSISAKRKLSPKKILLLAGLTVAIIACVFVFPNPVKKRFGDIMQGDIRVIRQEKFDPGDYFTGLQFRLLQWKFVPEILSENHSWLKGVSAGDAQTYLDQKYISKKMYIGDPVSGGTGFLGYNAHNEWLQALLQSGIPGLLSFLFICITLVTMAWKRKKTELSFIVLFLIAYTFTDSVFEMQYAILIFIFFPLLFYQDQKT